MQSNSKHILTNIRGYLSLQRFYMPIVITHSFIRNKIAFQYFLFVNYLFPSFKGTRNKLFDSTHQES